MLTPAIALLHHSQCFARTCLHPDGLINESFAYGRILAHKISYAVGQEWKGLRVKKRTRTSYNAQPYLVDQLQVCTSNDQTTHHLVVPVLGRQLEWRNSMLQGNTHDEEPIQPSLQSAEALQAIDLAFKFTVKMMPDRVMLYGHTILNPQAF